MGLFLVWANFGWLRSWLRPATSASIKALLSLSLFYDFEGQQDQYVADDFAVFEICWYNRWLFGWLWVYGLLRRFWRFGGAGGDGGFLGYRMVISRGGVMMGSIVSFTFWAYFGFGVVGISSFSNHF